MQKPVECRGCPLFHSGTSFSRPEGRCSNRVLLVGEALGREEGIDGLPFRPHAEAGSMLERCLKLAHVQRDSFALWNIVGCQPPNNFLEGAPWEFGAINHCSKHFERVVEQFEPKVIVALGNVAFRTLTGVEGYRRGITESRGFVFESKYGYVVPALHPSFLRRGQTKYAITLVHDIKKAINIALGVFTNFEQHKLYKKPQYIEYPSLDDARSFLYRVKDNVRLPLAYDLETLTSQDMEEDELDQIEENEITTIQFSLEPRTGICFPWKEEYWLLAKQILGCENVKYGHNVYEFDNPILKAKNVRVEGVIHDTMNMWHHLWSDLDKGLQKVVSMLGFPFPWKHLSRVRGEKAKYGIADVDAVQYILNMVPQQMKEKGVWEGYEKQVVGLHPTLTNASGRGIRVNRDRHTKFADAVKAKIVETNTELQRLIPWQVKKLDPEEGYTKTQPWIREAVHTYGTLREKFKKKNPSKEPESLDQYLYRKYRLVKRKFELVVPPLFAEAEDSKMVEERWAIELPFKTSKDQIVSYIKYMRHKTGNKKYEVPLTLKDEKETTSKDEIKRLAWATNDDVFFKIIEHRELTKVLGNDVKNWQPGEDEKVHTTFTYRPATGQLSSRRPNAQNAPKHADLADRFRDIIVPSPGCVLIEVDFSGFHARMTGRESRDKAYYTLAGLDIHSFLASYLKQVNQPVPLEVHRLNDISYIAELEERLGYIKKHFKKIRDEIAKRTILGWGFGMGPNKAFYLYRESYGTLKVAQDTFDMLEVLFPEATSWRWEIRKTAHYQTFLRSLWGYVRHFFEVFRNVKKNGKWKLVPGQDSEAAIAFLPANHAFGMIKSVMLRLEKRGANERYRFINTVHDSLLFDCPIKLAQDCISEVYQLMTKPCVTLKDEVICPGGFQVGAGVSVGMDSWSKKKMVEFKKGTTEKIVRGEVDWMDEYEKVSKVA